MQKIGKIYKGYWPALIFGTSKPVGLTPRQAMLLTNIVRETTRLKDRPTGKPDAKGKLVYYKPHSDRPDRAEIFVNGLVYNSAYVAAASSAPPWTR